MESPLEREMESPLEREMESPLEREKVESATVALLQLHCRRWLPAAVCPRRLVLRAVLPLTPTGKVDRGTLKLEIAREIAKMESRAARRTRATHPMDPLEACVAQVSK